MTKRSTRKTSSEDIGVDFVVTVSDTHCGSDVGLMPETLRLPKGNVVTIGDNVLQRWLLEKWRVAEELVYNLTKGYRVLLAFNGDAIEGSHHRTTELVAQDKMRHVQAFMQCAERLVEMSDHRIVIKGTECHTENFEHEIASRINPIGGEARDKWFIETRGVKHDFAHHIGTSSRKYLEGSQLSIAMGNAELCASRVGHPPAHVYWRGHRHGGGYYSDGNRTMVVTGAWQFLTRYGFKVVTDAIPVPSIKVADLRNLSDHCPLPHIINYRFNPPAPEYTKV